MSKPTIAIFGINGFLGKPILEALESPQFASQISFPIVAVTRDSSKFTDSETVVYKQGSVEDVEGLKTALKGVDVVINVGSAVISSDPIADAAKAVGAKLYLPTQFGMDIPKFATYLSVLDSKIEHSKYARSLGLKTVDVSTGFFAVPGSLMYEFLGAVGVDAEAKKATILGDADAKLAVITLPDLGKAVASLVTKDPATLPDKIRFFSDEVSQEEIIKRYEETHNVKIERSYLSAEAGLQKAKDLLADHGFSLNDFVYYLNVAIGLGVSAGVVFPENEREIVNPGESVFKWGKF